MVSDYRQKTACYAMLVRIVDASAQVALNPRRLRPYRSISENIVPLGNLTFSGVVVRASPERFVLRTRGGDQMIVLRQDTSYLQDGANAASSMVRVNARVFVRGSRNFENEIEAYQVIAGSILRP
jgi:hypothetical protein